MSVKNDFLIHRRVIRKLPGIVGPTRVTRARATPNLAKPPFFILRQSPVGKTVHIVVARFDVHIDGNAVYGFDLSSINSNGYFRHITLSHLRGLCLISDVLCSFRAARVAPSAPEKTNSVQAITAQKGVADSTFLEGPEPSRGTIHISVQQKEDC